MCVVKPVGFDLVAGIALMALAIPMASDAQAGVIGYSTLQITNVVISSGGDQVDPASMNFTTATSDRASFDAAPGISNSNPTNAVMTCVGACGGIARNDFDQVASGHSVLYFGRGDLALNGTILQPGGINTTDETRLIHQAGSNAGGEVSSTGFFSSIDFTPPASNITLTFDAFGDRLASSQGPNGFARADFSWTLLLADLTDNGAPTGLFLPTALNRRITASEMDTTTRSVNDSFQLTVSGLQANRQYRITFAQQ